ncbi:BtpA/SgcQ family protein [Aureimonas sp. ME7]|uniref:BtpA/SgcQ family protein n=1 Tax=Aureimonas sp. ME7 TaxID=2744252 RepID=UPI0015FA0A59|nr:BtpA/SgcQ family protein [Aureimonas sp. ME7]
MSFFPAADAADPFIIAALHLPDLSVRRDTSTAFLEDYVLANTRVFLDAGIHRIMLQDQTRQKGPATAETIAVTAALGRTMKRENPELSLGIIVQAHDAVAPLAIAHASGADFVRLKIFVGAAMTMEGTREPLAVEARTYRHQIRRDDIAILADVFDRTCVPLIDVSPEEAAKGAVKFGADGLVITGATFSESLARIRAAKAAGVVRPILLGGSVTSENIAETLAVADGAIVSTDLMRRGAGPADLLHWDTEKARRLVDAAHGA